MPKSKRLLELMMTVNRKRKFTVKELAQEFGVSTRTMLRDLQELSELGVPLYSEVGPHGGYQVIRERTLPPIAFTEEEALAFFFASHALRHYSALPFQSETSSALQKFYLHMPGDTRERIDLLKNRIDIFVPRRQADFPFLTILLDGAVKQKSVWIQYDSPRGTTQRKIRPFGIYAEGGIWYCPAHCFLREKTRLFRCDRITSAVWAQEEDDLPVEALNWENTHLGNWDSPSEIKTEEELLPFYTEFSKDVSPVMEAELGRRMTIQVLPDGSGYIRAWIPKDDLDFFAHLFIRIGEQATVYEPPELIENINIKLESLMKKYRGNSCTDVKDKLSVMKGERDER
ncbi:YafY family transcriptional regulator [Neobacillus mesonae]|nr:YafY family transcriptional regulator [Neobacillus mesonae]